jgi:hypothetical protein
MSISASRRDHGTTNSDYSKATFFDTIVYGMVIAVKHVVKGGLHRSGIHSIICSPAPATIRAAVTQTWRFTSVEEG